jgi:Zn-dependent protease with chaperone function
LGGVLRKAMTQQASREMQSQDPPWLTVAQHLLLVGATAGRANWFDAHPPLELRIRRIYGRSMAPLPLRHSALAVD